MKKWGMENPVINHILCKPLECEYAGSILLSHIHIHKAMLCVLA